MSETVSTQAVQILVVDDNQTVRRAVRRTLERAGYAVTEASDGRQGLERAQHNPPDLILVDRVMPHMDGERLCDALSADAALKDVPVVLMTAQVADPVSTLSRAGAMELIEKPFSPEALLAVTAHALRRPAAAIAQVLAGALIDSVQRLADRGVSRDHLAEVITESLSAAQLLELPAALRAELPEDLGELSFQGRSDHVPLAELLQLLQHQQQSGVLTVTRRSPQAPARSVAICMRNGLIELALGSGSEPEFLLGRYLLQEDLVDGDELHMLLQRGRARGLLGAQLIKLGTISAADLRRALVRQTNELVYETLRWPSARYRFQRWATRPEARDAKLGLPVAALLMEGLRRVDEWRLIEEQISNMHMRLAVRRDTLDGIDDDELSTEQRAVIAALDGERTVSEVVSHLNCSSFEACKALFSLMTTGLVQET